MTSLLPLRASQSHPGHSTRKLPLPPGGAAPGQRAPFLRRSPLLRVTSPPRPERGAPFLLRAGGGGRATPAPLPPRLAGGGLTAPGDWPARPPITGERVGPAQLGLGPWRGGPSGVAAAAGSGRAWRRGRACPRGAGRRGRRGVGPTWRVPARAAASPQGRGRGRSRGARGLSRFWREALRRRRGRVGGCCCCCCRVSWSPRLRWLWRPPCSLTGATVATHLGEGRGKWAAPDADWTARGSHWAPRLSITGQRLLPPVGPEGRLWPGCLALPLVALRRPSQRLDRGPACQAGN